MGSNGVSGVILAGGASRRMGSDKALLQLDGQPLIVVVAERLRAVTDEVILVADEGGRYRGLTDRTVPDIYPGVGTLGGIHAGLVAASYDLALVVACDMPSLDPRVLSWFVGVAEGVDLVVLRHSKGVEPLHAVYRKTCLPAIEDTIRSGERCAFAFYDRIRVRYVAPQELSMLDPELASFANVNTPAEWREAQRLAGVIP